MAMPPPPPRFPPRFPSIPATSDAPVQGTNDDAQLSKLSCHRLGYFKDEFVQYFVKRPTRRSPLINRGYYSRYAALRQLLLSFLGRVSASSPEQAPAEQSHGEATAAPEQAAASPEEAAVSPAQATSPEQAPDGADAAAHGAEEAGEGDAPTTTSKGPKGKVQVLSLGAGFDTTWFQLKREGLQPTKYFELDFLEVTQRKALVVARRAPLQELLHDGPETVVDVDKGRIVTPDYTLMPADLRDLPAVERALAAMGFDFDAPTYVLSECVFVYMEPEFSNRVVEWLGQALSTAVCVVYEQIKPDDAFGRQMLMNLECRGVPLKGIRGTPTLEAHEQRFLTRGWTRVRSLDMDTIYRLHLEPTDKQRIERLEIFDEFEEWTMLQSHYSITVAVKDAQGVLEGYGLPDFGSVR